MARKATFEDLEQRIRVLDEECAKGKQAAEGLVKERDFTSAILDTAGALVVVLDREGRITRFNRACEQVTGYSAAAVSGRVFWEFLVPPEELQGVMHTWKALQAGNFPNQHENRWVAKNGSRRIISWTNTAVVDPRGEVAHIIATGIDISERKQVEDALQRERHALGERVRELGCLYRFFELIAKPGISFEGILQGTTDLLPSGWSLYNYEAYYGVAWIKARNCPFIFETPKE